MLKFDPHKSKEKWENWKKNNESGISEISVYNSKIILQYLKDMEMGINVAIVTSGGIAKEIGGLSLDKRNLSPILKAESIEEAIKIILEKISTK